MTLWRAGRGQRLVWIGAAHFGAGLLGREHPFHVCAGEIALALAGGDLALEFLAVVDAPSRHWRLSTPISISTMLSQLACLGV